MKIRITKTTPYRPAALSSYSNPKPIGYIAFYTDLERLDRIMKKSYLTTFEVTTWFDLLVVVDKSRYAYFSLRGKCDHFRSQGFLQFMNHYSYIDLTITY